MYIVVRYGVDEALLFNPKCRIANLLANIKLRCGYSELAEICLDLTDETGLVKDLPSHPRQYGSKFLSSPGNYVLIERRKVPVEKPVDSQGEEEVEGPPPTETTYLPLLFNTDQLLPGYNVRSVQRNAALPEKGRKGRHTKRAEDKSLTAPASPTPRVPSNMSSTKNRTKANKRTR